MHCHLFLEHNRHLFTCDLSWHTVKIGSIYETRQNKQIAEYLLELGGYQCSAWFAFFLAVCRVLSDYGYYAASVCDATFVTAFVSQTTTVHTNILLHASLGRKRKEKRQ